MFLPSGDSELASGIVVECIKIDTYEIACFSRSVDTSPEINVLCEYSLSAEYNGRPSSGPMTSSASFMFSSCLCCVCPSGKCDGGQSRDYVYQASSKVNVRNLVAMSRPLPCLSGAK